MNDKKTLIYNAAIEMISSGMSEADITIADIAKKANIGKGTVYEYFDSKNELLFCTMEYFATQVLGKLREVCSSGSFRQRFISVLTQLDEVIRSGRPLYNFIFANHDSLCIKNPYNNPLCGELFDRVNTIIFEIMQTLIKCGQQEGVLSPDITNRDIFFAFSSVAGAVNLNSYEHAKMNCGKTDDFFGYCYNMFVKILN